MKKLTLILTMFAGALFVLGSFVNAQTTSNLHKPIDEFQGRPPIHVKGNSTLSPSGYSPSQVKAAYNLTAATGSGTIAIIDAYDYPTAEQDLNVFSSQFGLPSCTTANGCFKKVMMNRKVRANSGWALEAALDTQWAHAIAPNAKIMLVEAKSASGADLLAAVDYARKQPGVVAVSMSWGGSEFSGEASYDSYFTSQNGGPISFFASSGDSGTGASWPAVSVNITSVGGTTLVNNGGTWTETAWSGSGGGISSYVSEPSYQTAYGITLSNGRRAIPDVSYVADPQTGVSVYDSTTYQGQTGWFTVGGTSAGAPQWAAIRALGTVVNNAHLYPDATSSYSHYFRDVVTGTNGTCGYVCTAQTNYDFVTGLGSPLTMSY